MAGIPNRPNPEAPEWTPQAIRVWEIEMLHRAVEKNKAKIEQLEACETIDQLSGVLRSFEPRPACLDRLMPRLVDAVPRISALENKGGSGSVKEWAKARGRVAQTVGKVLAWVEDRKRAQEPGAKEGPMARRNEAWLDARCQELEQLVDELLPNEPPANELNEG